jgi:hypothetical protein
MIRFRAVRIDVETQDGRRAAFETSFDEGLVVISGHNSIGKTLLFQSMIFGLGMEGMYGAGSQTGLLTRAVTQAIELDGEEYSVRRSSITMEIENGEGEILSTRRVVVGENDHLVATWRHQMLTAPADESGRRDFFVRQSHATTAESGFHHMLAEFMGWDLPQVPTYNRTEVPLYPELLFPLFAIEQKSGWAGLLPRLPTYLQVRDPLQRGIEFILGLNLLQRERELQRLADREALLARQFATVASALETTARLRGARIVGLPDWGTVRRTAPKGDLPELRAETLVGSSWVLIETALVQASETTPSDEIVVEQTPEHRDAGALNTRMNEANEELRTLAIQLTAVEETMDIVHAQLGSLRTRLAAVDEEKRRYEELVTLVNLGSPVAVATFGHKDCPTCQQSLDNLEHQPHLQTLNYEQSLSFLTEQARTLRALQADAQRAVDDQVIIRTSLERRAEELRREVRAIQADLVTPEEYPSIADLQKRLAEENRVSDLQRLGVEILEHSESIGEIVAAERVILQERRALGTGDLSPEEQERLDMWTKSFRDLLHEFEVTTVPIDQIELPVSGKPGAEDFGDIGFQASASDNIRLRWAYAISLMRTSCALNGPHPLVIMMDEPKQQEVEAFPKLVEVASTQSPGQIILVTSQSAQAIREAQIGKTQIIELRDKLLQTVTDS